MKRTGTVVAIVGRCMVLVLCVLAGCAELPVRDQAKESVTASPVSSLTRVYVANESSNSVSVIDGVTFQPIGTVDARNHSTHDLALSRDGKRLFATNLASGRLSVMIV